MKRIVIIMYVCICGQLSLQAQGVEAVLRSVEQNNKAFQARQKNNEAEKSVIDAENGLQDPSVAYSSFFSKEVNGQAGSELVVSQGFDFPTVYAVRGKAGRTRKEAVDWRAESLRRDILLEAQSLCFDLIWSNKVCSLLEQRGRNATELLALYEERLKAGDATLIEVNKIKMERMSVQTEILRNNTFHRTTLQNLLALNGNMPLTFEETEYPSLDASLLSDSGTLYDVVILGDAELLAAEAEARANEQMAVATRRNWLPRIEVGYRRNTREDTKEHGFLVGGSVPFFSNHRQVKMAEARTVGGRLDYEDARMKAEASFHAGFNEMRQLQQAMEVYDTSLMYQTLDLLGEGVKGGAMSLTDYFVEADVVYRNLQAYMELENRYRKVVAILLKNRL